MEAGGVLDPSRQSRDPGGSSRRLLLGQGHDVRVARSANLPARSPLSRQGQATRGVIVWTVGRRWREKMVDRGFP